MTTVMAETPYLPEADVTVNVFPLTDADRNEVLAFLAERPVQTVCLAGLIRDNGLVSIHNRGKFYGCRNSEDRLEGIALIGHATLVEARTARAMQEFGLAAQAYQHTHMILGEKEKIEQFWNYYADEGQELRLACRELLFEARRAMQLEEEVAGLRRATISIRLRRSRRAWPSVKAVSIRSKSIAKAFAPDARAASRWAAFGFWNIMAG
jgi:hypothetical protein